MHISRFLSSMCILGWCIRQWSLKEVASGWLLNQTLRTCEKSASYSTSLCLFPHRGGRAVSFIWVHVYKILRSVAGTQCTPYMLAIIIIFCKYSLCTVEWALIVFIFFFVMQVPDSSLDCRGSISTQVFTSKMADGYFKWTHCQPKTGARLPLPSTEALFF